MRQLPELKSVSPAAVMQYSRDPRSLVGSIPPYDEDGSS